jgi:uncharacterized protein (DUF927 family)
VTEQYNDDADAFSRIDWRAEAERAKDGNILPSGFILNETGLFRLESDPKKPPLHVAGIIAVVASTHDGAGNDWGRLVQWLDDDGRAHEWPMPLALLAGDGVAIRERLLREGLFVGPSRREREALMAYLLRCQPTKRLRITLRTGWHDASAGHVFVLPNETIGVDGDGVRLQTDRPDLLPPVATSGILQDWQKTVALSATYSMRAILAISMAFAAPLLCPLGVESGGVHLRGPSSIGKTTLLLAAGSVCGGGGLHGWVKSWRATDNGLEAAAAAHNDLLLCLDEMSEVSATAAGATAYMLANGSGKSRATRDGSGRRPAEWRLLFLSSGEIGLADKVAEDGRQRRIRAGEAVRVLDVPADAGKGCGVFDKVPDGTTPAELQQQIATGARKYYGVALREFLCRLTVQRHAAIVEVRRTRDEFVLRELPSGAGGQVRRAAERFGLIAAAGELAVNLAVLPWMQGHPSAAASECFRAWLVARGGAGAGEDIAAVTAVRAFLAAHGSSRFEVIGEPPPSNGDPVSTAPFDPRIANRAGWRRWNKHERLWDYLISPNAWRDEICRGLDPTNAARALHEGGYLVRGDDDHFAGRATIPGFPRTRVYIVSGRIFNDAATQ